MSRNSGPLEAASQYARLPSSLRNAPKRHQDRDTPAACVSMNCPKAVFLSSVPVYPAYVSLLATELGPHLTSPLSLHRLPAIHSRRPNQSSKHVCSDLVCDGA